MLGLVPGEEAHDDLRVPVEQPARQERPLPIHHIDRIPILRLSLDPRNRARKHPRMALAHRLLAPRLQNDARIGHRWLPVTTTLPGNAIAAPETLPRWIDE